MGYCDVAAMDVSPPGNHEAAGVYTEAAGFVSR